MVNKLNKKKSSASSVFIISLVLSVILIVIGLFFPSQLDTVMNAAFDFLTNNFTWTYLLSMMLFVVFALFIAFSKWGKIRLGPDDSRPQYSTLSWFTMLFTSGMGIGIVFWSVAEPIEHFLNFGATPDAAAFAMKKTVMHWSFHPWATYAVIGLAFAYFQFRKKTPSLMSSMLTPLIGEKRAKGKLGKAIDIFVILATVVGVASSMGQGILQINAGLNHTFGVNVNFITQVIIALIITAVFLFISQLGIDKGIKVMSDFNLYLAGAIALVVFLLANGSTVFNNMINTIGNYLGSFIQDSLATKPFESKEWLGSWTIFYWAWWICWGPFVGTFIARISKGRTIREFILGVLVLPSIVSMLWFSIFGTLGIGTDIALLNTIQGKAENALFVVFSQFGFGNVLSVAAIILLCIFFVVSANSSTYVLAMFTDKGSLNPSNKKKIIWGLVPAVLSLALLATGGLSALKTSLVLVAFPLIVIIIMVCISIYKALGKEKNLKKNDNNGTVIKDD